MTQRSHSVEWKLKVGVDGSDQVRALRAELEKAGKIKAFAQLKKQTAESGQAWQAATARVSALAREIAALEKPSKKHVQALERSKKEAAALKEKYESLRAATSKLRGELGQSGVNTARLGAAQQQVKTRLGELNRAVDTATRRQALFRKALEATSAASGKTGNAVRDMVAAYVGLNAVQSGGQYILQAAQASEQSVYNLEASVRAANREFGGGVGTMEQWTSRLRELGQELKIYSNSELRNAASRTIDMTKRLGLSTRQMDDVIRMAANLGAGKTNLEGAIERITAALRGEAESAEFLGLTLNETYVKAQYEAANATGKLWKELTDVEKAQARYAVLVQQASGMNGRAAESVNTLNGALAYMRATIDNSLESNEDLRESIKRASKEIAEAAPEAVKFATALASVLANVLKLLAALPDGTAEVLTYGLIGKMLFGTKGAVLIGGGAYLLQSLTQSVEGFKRAMSGDISFWDYMWSNREQLEAYLDKADVERLKKEQDQAREMRRITAEYYQSIRDNNKDYVHASTALERIRAEAVKSIEDDLAAFRAVKWEEFSRQAEAALKKAQDEEKKYSDQVKRLQEERSRVSMTAQERVRSMLRSTMSDYDAYIDRQKEAQESLNKARLALQGGDAGLAETWAKKAQEQFSGLNAEVRDGERVLISASKAQATAVGGYLAATRELERSLLAQEQSAESNRAAAEKQIEQIKDDLETIKTMQEQVRNLEIQLSADDKSTPVLRSIQAEMAMIRDKTVTVTVRYRKEGSEGRAQGGYIPGYFSGGRLPGFSRRDNMLGLIRGRRPIGLAGGEFVTNATSSRVLAAIAPGLMEGLNRVRTGVDLSDVLERAQGLATGGRVAESYRFTFVSGGKEASVTTSSRTEADSLLALAAAMQRQKLVSGV